jgi:RHS repeat-associated protein
VTGGIDWAYDDSLRVTSETVTGGAGISFTYDDDSLLTAAGAFVITRDAVNGLADSAALGVVSDAWSYNSFGEITDTIVTANAVPVFDASFTRDALGRIIQKVETITGATYIYDYDYDLRGRLIEVQKDSVVIESYSYDDNGNRLSATLGGITVNGAYDTQERLLTYAGNSYAYTPAGRLLSRTEPGVLLTEYDYDIVGNLLGVTLPDATEITYELDGLDRRVQRSVNGTITQRLLYNGLRPVAELDPLGNVVSQYIYAGTHVPAYMIKAGVNYRFVADQVGSVRLVVNAATGNVAQRIDYDSFGNVLNDTNPGFQPFGFAGGIHDPLTGLVRFGARDYDPQSGRWTARDPSGFAGGLNLYQYAMSDPINYFDVTGRGLSTYIVQLVIAGVVVGVVIDIFSERGLEQIIRDIASSILGSTPVVGPAMQPLTQPDKDFYTGLIELCRGNVLMGSGGPKEYGAPPPNPDAPYIPDELLNEKPFERTHSTDTAAGRLIEDLERF